MLKGAPDRTPEGNAVQFRLTYEGLLLAATSDNPRAKHKHEIRKAFHPQLRQLWNITPHLKEMRDPPLDLVEVNRGPDRSRIEGLAEQWTRCGYRFVPLITEDLSVSECALDILFLRPDAPGALISSGDMDNRLKVLFDALRIPANKGELGGYDTPAEGEDPFFCLLQDDKLITKISVETDLLLEPTGNSPNVNDSRLIIRVNIQPAIARLDLKFRSVNFR
jgi:hypothetical protein